ncbi:piggyBac transposable element-derived protein 3-like [Anthonomus grandis grandis]|uniref:piggyBac transposable element-derived protein 3-like n=1 Tax=Anthonomus grandis grandis TaxID=2921223 RepID=UPI002166BE7E|nr:piggyBac transposable element-derived protein 3-like [Anthonomus grandis grandis]
MGRNRFFKIRNYLHAVNNLEVSDEEQKRDKLWKVRPIITSFHNAVLRLPREENVSIDKQMIPFSGKVAIRQYVPRKPNPTGLKNYVLASKNGTILDFEIYQGKITNFPEDVEKKNLGAGGRAVLRLSETCSPGTNIYFDRSFTSVTLLDKLREKGISGTGTTMSNRFPKVGFPTDYELKKLGRGIIKTKVRDNKKVALVRWMDNKAITMASSAHSINPIHQCRRYSRPDLQYLNVPQPDVVRRYNEFMEGVDLLCYHKTKK